MLKKLYWYILHRVWPPYRYNLIRIKSLEPGYHDPETRMLHACFDLFAEWFHYVVFEAKIMTHETIDADTEGLYDEMMTLYKWWTIEKPCHDALDDVTFDEHCAFEQIEDQMLMRLVTIRRHIWYP